MSLLCAALLAASPNASTADLAKQDAAVEREFERLYAEHQDAGSLAPFVWHLKNIVEDLDMPGLQDSQGIPVKLHGVRIKGDLADVVEDVAQQFTRGGLYMEPVLKQPQLTAETQVTALDWSRFISYTALIQPEKKSGTCMVVLGEANIGLAAAMRKMHQAPDFAPLPPSAKYVVRNRAEGLQTLSFTAATGEGEVKKWYSDEMKRRGYAEGSGSFTKGDEEIRFSVRRDKGEVVVMLIRRNVDH